MFLEQIGERFVRQFLKGRHPVARELRQLVESVVVEGDQLAHDCLPPASPRMVINSGRWKLFQPRNQQDARRWGRASSGMMRRSAEHPVFSEPGLHPAPRILGGFLAITCAIIGMEAVRCARIDFEFGGFPGRRQGGL